MRVAILCALVAVAACVEYRDISYMLSDPGPHAMPFSFAGDEVSRSTRDVSCPIPTTCPIGYIGSQCQNIKCPNRGPTPHSGGSFTIDKMAYTTCDSRRRIVVDSHIKTPLTLLLDTPNAGNKLQLALYDTQGNPVQGTTITNNSKSLEIQYPISQFGFYDATFRAGGQCVFTVFAHSTDLTVKAGFSLSKLDDSPKPTVQQFTFSYIMAQAIGLPKPGYARVVEVYENTKLLYSYDFQQRYGCGYSLVAGPIICRSIDTYWYKIYGRDENGYDFERLETIQCVSNTNMTTTTMAPTGSTTTGTGLQCQHGGFDTGNGFCYCPPNWTGKLCQNIICNNGGTANGDTCTCAPNYAGQFCETTMCAKKNPVNPGTPNNRALVFVVQTTQSMTTDVFTLKAYLSAIIDQFREHHTQFLTKFGLVIFDDKYDLVAYFGESADNFINALHRLFLTPPPQKCKKPILVSLETALKLAGVGGYVYVMTDSPRLENSTAILDIYSRIENTGTQVSFIVTPNGDNCAASIGDFLVYSEIARFSGGELYNLNSKRTIAQALATLPSIYMSARSQERTFSDCSQGQEFTMFVDSHMASATITVNGKIPRIDIQTDTGEHCDERRGCYDVLNDPNVKVRQAITPCDMGWTQFGSACYLGNLKAKTWQDAQQDCKSMGGHMVNILNGEKQTFLNHQMKGINYWTGLNDIQQEGQFYWDGPIPLKLDNYFTNWAPGQPAQDPNHQKNCVGVQHTLVNDTISDARWYPMSCGQTLPYTCQKHAYDFNNNRLSAGYWRVRVRTSPDQQSNMCTVRVRVQTDLQVMSGFTDTAFNDYPQQQPGGTGQSYMVAALPPGDNGHFDGFEQFSFNDTFLGSIKIMQRANCFYNWATQKPLQCQAKYLSIGFHGHDELQKAFARLRDAYCLDAGTPEQRYAKLDK